MNQRQKQPDFIFFNLLSLELKNTCSSKDGNNCEPWNTDQQLASTDYANQSKSSPSETVLKFQTHFSSYSSIL